MKSLQMTVIMQNLCLMQKPIWLFYAQKEEARLPPAFNSTDLLVPNRRARFFCLTMQCMIQRVGIESRDRLTLPYILPDFIYISPFPNGVVSKQKIERILVPIDGSDNAFRAASFAVDLATKYGSELLLLYAFDLNQIRYSIGLIGVGYPSNIVQIKENVAKEAAPWFERVQKEADSAGVAVKTDVIDAVLSVVEEILDCADRKKIDLIVIGSRGRTGFKKLLLGSIASGLVTHVACPVMVIK